MTWNDQLQTPLHSINFDTAKSKYLQLYDIGLKVTSVPFFIRKCTQMMDGRAVNLRQSHIITLDKLSEHLVVNGTRATDTLALKSVNGR